MTTMVSVTPDITSNPAVDTTDKAALLLRLDELLENYLNTLDKYQIAQQQLSKHFASGFLALAKANFNTQSRTRYGRDYYDERMQASRKISITPSTPSTAATFTLHSSAAPISPTPETPPETQPLDSAPETQDEAAKEGKVSRDPLRWFGILVPNALRDAQRAFGEGVQGPVPTLAGLVGELRRCEVEIGRVRKMIRRL